MGVDLALMPLDYEMPRLTCSFSRIETNRHHGLLEAIEARKSEYRIIPEVECYGGQDGKYTTRKTTPYGDPLTVATAEQLEAFAKHEGVLDNAQNRAVWAYVKARGGDFILFWH